MNSGPRDHGPEWRTGDKGVQAPGNRDIIIIYFSSPILKSRYKSKAKSKNLKYILWLVYMSLVANNSYTIATEWALSKTQNYLPYNDSMTAFIGPALYMKLIGTATPYAKL